MDEEVMQEPESMDFACPSCSATITFHKMLHGTAAECPMCFEIIVLAARDGGTGTKLPIPINTQRLRLRPLRNEDVADLIETATDEESYKFLDGFPPDEESAREWFVRSVTAKFTDPDGRLLLVIELLDTQKLIGWISFSLSSSQAEEAANRQGQFNLMLHPGHRAKGYGTETLSGVLKFAFDGIHLHDIRCGIDSRNVAARRMAEKSGMIVEGDFIENEFRKGEWVSTTYYRMLASEYKRAT